MIVAGLGALGGGATRALAARGLTVVGVDRHHPPHRWGSSHGGSRIIRRVYPEGACFQPLLEPAYRGWRRLEAECGRRLLLETGCLFLGPPGCRLFEDALESARRAAVPHERLAAAELARRFPALRPPPQLAGVLDPQGGVLRLEPCLEVLLEGARAAGAELRFGCALAGWRSAGEAVEVELDDGSRLGARHLVLALGAWLAERLEPGELVIERQVQHWFQPPQGGLGPDELPPFVWELEPGRAWYAVPDLGDGVKAALHHGGAQTTADTVDRRVRTKEVAEVRSLLERHLPAAAGPCRASRVCLYSNTPEHRFLAGPLPGRPRVWLLGGGSGHGFKFAPRLGELLAEALVDGRLPTDLEPFRPPPPGLRAADPGLRPV